MAQAVSTRRIRNAAALLCLLVGRGGLAAPLADVRPQLTRGRFTSVGGPVLVSWAGGVSDPADLERYVDTGFNTVNLTISASAADSPDVRRAVDFALQAGRRGLWVLVTLNAVEALCGPTPLAAGDPEEQQRHGRWLAELVNVFRPLPNVLGYALQDDLEERLAWRYPDFLAWLARRYGAIGALNGAWGVTLGAYEQVGPGLVNTLDARRPAGFGRPSLDLARWRMDTVAGILRQWAREVHAVDPARPVLGGRMTRGRTLLVAPEELGGLQPTMLPGRPGARQADPGELATLASQAGRFAPLVGLDSAAAAGVLRAWVRAAAGRGVAGLSFARWEDLKADDVRRRAVSAALTELERHRAARFTARSGTAIVLQPYVKGPEDYGPQWYGYGSFGGAQPLGLLDYVRRATNYGPPEVLTPRDLTRVDLARFGCLFLPSAFELSAAQLAVLTRYVDGGGILVADFGFACAEPVGDPVRWPEAAGKLFGVQPIEVQRLMDVVLDEEGRERLLNLRPGESPFPGMPATIPAPGSFLVREETPLFPDVRVWDGSSNAIVANLLASPALFCVPLGEAHVIALQAQIPVTNPVYAPGAGLFQRNQGLGSAVFCSSMMWESWRPGDDLFDGLHHGLFSRRPALELLTVPGQEPSAWYVARDGDRLWIERRAAGAGEVVVDLPCLAGHCLVGGLNVVRRVPPPKPGRRAEGEPLVNRRIVWLEAGELRHDAPAPVTIWPLDQPVAVALAVYGPRRIVLEVFGPGERAVRDATGLWRVERPGLGEGILRLADGPYRLRPGSLHRVEWRRRVAREHPAGDTVVEGDTVQRSTVTVGPDSQIVIREAFRADRLTITPVAPEPEDPTGAAAPE
jgi:hypothetical protein